MAERRASDWFIGGFLALQIALPTGYYLTGGSTDERFAWRMFSSKRLAKCTYQVVADGQPVDVPAAVGHNGMTMDLLPRGEPDVVIGLLRWWCAERRAQEVSYANACTMPDGSVPPARRASLSCASGALDDGELP